MSALGFVLHVESERQRERLWVKLTADRPVQGQRAQTNLISDGCLSIDFRTITLMEPDGAFPFNAGLSLFNHLRKSVPVLKNI